MADAIVMIAREAERRDAVARNVLHVCAWTFVGLALAFAAVAAWASDMFFLRLATEALILGGLALAVDILLGYTGLLSLGHALFFGFGAYVSGLVLKHLEPSFWTAMLVVLVTASAAGAITGIIAIRTRGAYFVLITFALAQIVSKIVFNTPELGSSDGIIGIPVISVNFGLFSIDTGHTLSLFLLVLAVIMGLYAFTAYLMDTPFGRTLAAIRTNEARVSFLGFNPWRYKLAAFILAADVAALSGALYPMLRGFVSPELMFFQVSGHAVITVVVGGVGTLIGPLYGSVILTALKSLVGTFTEHHLIIIGLVFMMSVLFLPKGLMGYVRPGFERWLGGRSGSA